MFVSSSVGGFQAKEIGGSSRPPVSAKLVEQSAEKKKGLGDWMNIIKPVNEEKDHWVGFFVLLERKHISLVVKVKGQGSFGDQLHHLLFLLLLLSCGYIVLTPCYFWLQVPDEAVSKCTSCGSDFGAFIRRVLFSLILQSELSSWPWYAKPYGFLFIFQHHCRNCGDVFCDKCTQGRIALTAEDNAPQVRVCDRCMVCLSICSFFLNLRNHVPQIPENVLIQL